MQKQTLNQATKHVSQRNKMACGYKKPMRSRTPPKTFVPVYKKVAGKKVSLSAKQVMDRIEKSNRR